MDIKFRSLSGVIIDNFVYNIALPALGSIFNDNSLKI